MLFLILPGGKPMLSNEDELQERSGVNAEDRPCRNCGGHEAHPGQRCNERERIGKNSFGGYCCCTTYEPQDASDILSAEHPEEI
jgi:hypothetical protein